MGEAAQTAENPARASGRGNEKEYLMQKSFKSDTILGDRYRDPVTGFEGVATAVTFYLHACERISIEFAKDGEIKFESFDAPRLVHVETDKPLTTTRTGGPGGREARPNPSGPRR